MLLPEKTVRYKTFLKTTMVEALTPVFAGHTDKFLQSTKVTLDFPLTREAYPSLQVRFFERDIKNAGVGHFEIAFDPDTFTNVKYKHYYYDGDLEFAVFALSSLDRDLMADTFVQTATMGDLMKYTQPFLDRIYSPDATQIPDSLLNFVNINTDTIFGFGETQSPAPWGSEDQLVYQCNYRLPVFGEFYSLPPDIEPLSEITSVRIFPYIDGVEPAPVVTDNGGILIH